MWKNADISNIKSEYNIKEIFSYLDYPYILKLLKKNKNLQNILGLSLENYKNKYETKKYEYIKETKLITSEANLLRNTPEESVWYLLFSLSIICFIFLPFLIYSILLVSIKTFKDSNTKINYNKKYYNTIKIINPCLFIYDTFILISICIFSLGICYHGRRDYGRRKIIKFIITIFINLVNILFESLVIWKLILSYKIKRGGCTWFMVLDYLFLVLNLIYIIIFLIATISYFKESGNGINFKNEYYLTSFNKIKINNFKLPEDFGKLPKNERKKYIFDHYKDYEHTISKEQEKLLESINDFRGIKKIPLLGFCDLSKIPDFLFNEISEVMMWPDKNIFKISNKKYLFRYPIGNFEINFTNKDKNILSILLKDNLDHIQIITYQNLEYIFIYKSDSCDYHITNLFYYRDELDMKRKMFENKLDKNIYELECNKIICYE